MSGTSKRSLEMEDSENSKIVVVKPSWAEQQEVKSMQFKAIFSGWRLQAESRFVGLCSTKIGLIC